MIYMIARLARLFLADNRVMFKTTDLQGCRYVFHVVIPKKCNHYKEVGYEFKN